MLSTCFFKLPLWGAVFSQIVHMNDLSSSWIIYSLISGLKKLRFHMTCTRSMYISFVHPQGIFWHFVYSANFTFISWMIFYMKRFNVSPKITFHFKLSTTYTTLPWVVLRHVDQRTFNLFFYCSKNFWRIFFFFIIYLFLCLRFLCCLRAFIDLTFSPQISQLYPGWFSMCSDSMCLLRSRLALNGLWQTPQLQEWSSAT